MSVTNFLYLSLFILSGISCKPRQTIYAENNLTKTKNELTIFVDSSVLMPSRFWGNKLPQTDFHYYNFNTFSINTLTLKNGFVKLYNNNSFLLFETKTNIPHLIIPNEKYVLLFDNETGNFNIKSDNRTIQKELDFFYKSYNLTDSINNIFNKKNYKNYDLQFFDSTINKERLIDLYNKIKLDNSLLELEKEKLINIINHDKSQYS